MGTRKQGRQFPCRETIRSKNKSRGRHVVFAPRIRTLATQSNPMPFALAEYYAGASRAQRWSGGNDVEAMPAQTFLKKIDFPGTRKYVDSIIARYEFYKRRGRM